MVEHDTLPTDLLENIFSRLSTGLLFTFKKTRPGNTREHVTKLYYGDPQYEGKIKKYYSENTLTPVVPTVAILEPNGLVGSCNGLVCYKAVDPIYSKDGLAFKCHNPITGETAYIPGLENLGRSLLPPVGGFGYVDSTKEYKVVRISFKYWGPYFQVYTLGSHLGWRDKGLIVPRTFEANESGVFVNGALHWINVKGFKNKMMILAFGLAHEELWSIPYPPYIGSDMDCRNSKLILLGGNLCVVHSNHISENAKNKWLDIWNFKSESAKEKPPELCYDHTWNWSKKYRIAWEGYVLYTPFVLTKRNTILLWQNGTSNLCYYDPKTSRLEKYCVGDAHNNSYLQAIPHTNSLVSLKELGEI